VFNMQRAVLAKPQSMEFKNNLAWLFATCPEPSLRDGARSLMLAKEVTSSSAVPNAAYLDTLAAAYAETGQFDKAVEVTQQALDIATTNGDYKFSPDLEHRLRLYKNRMPYEEPDARKKQP
jgi:tetratricopeptide (TPR) repeat protein